MLKDGLEHNFDLKTAKIIDTTSGGSAFLAPLCKIMANRHLSAQAMIDDITDRLTGFELDPFAAWLSQFLVDCELALLAPSAKQPKPVIHNEDALTMSSALFGQYDYVIGNPPYKKIAKDAIPEERYDDVIHGAPNLYQLFYKLSFLLVRDGGYVHLITPTSFIGGAYFSALRNYIAANATGLSFSFFEERSHVFEGVQQELVISLFEKVKHDKPTMVRSVSAKNTDALTINDVGTIELHNLKSWVLPKTKAQLDVARIFFSKRRYTFKDIGYLVKTGYVVPHRSVGQLKKVNRADTHPMIWSEAIHNNAFCPDRVSSDKRKKWYRPDSNAGFITQPCILIKRTSSKEQHRRIHAAPVSQAYIDLHGGFFAENHLNVMQKVHATSIELSAVLKLLQTTLFDLLFRCINGTVTVSSSELNQIPIPSPEAFRAFSLHIKDCMDADTIEQAARVAYGVSYDQVFEY
jgi:adenine-specific DNA-methyltransferase